MGPGDGDDDKDFALEKKIGKAVGEQGERSDKPSSVGKRTGVKGGWGISPREFAGDEVALGATTYKVTASGDFLVVGAPKRASSAARLVKRASAPALWRAIGDKLMQQRRPVVESVRWSSRTIDIGEGRYQALPDGSLRTSKPTLGDNVGDVHKRGSTSWRKLSEMLVPKPRSASKAPTTLPELDATTGKRQFWEALHYVAAMDHDVEARAGWERIKSQYPKAFRAALEKVMAQRVKELGRRDLAFLRAHEPGRALPERDAAHVAGDAMVREGVVDKPATGVNTLFNLRPNDVVTNRRVQGRLETGAAAAARTQTGEAARKSAGLRRARALSARGLPPSLRRIADSFGAQDELVARLKATADAGGRTGKLGGAVRGLAAGGLAGLLHLALSAALSQAHGTLQAYEIQRQLTKLQPTIQNAFEKQQAIFDSMQQSDGHAAIYANVVVSVSVFSERRYGPEPPLLHPPTVDIKGAFFSRHAILDAPTTRREPDALGTREITEYVSCQLVHGIPAPPEQPGIRLK